MLVNANGTITTNGISHSGYHNAAGVTMLQQQQQQNHHQQQTVDSYGNAWISNNNNSMLSQQQQQQLQQRQEQQQQYQNMQMQMIYRAHQHQQQPTTNASMNGYPPCTSASPGGGVAPSAVVKHAALKRKSTPNGTDVDAAKKPAFSAVQFVQRPQAAIYQPQPYVMQQTPQQSSNLPSAITLPHLGGQLKYAAQYAGYDSPNHKYINNNNMNNPLVQQQQQAGARPNLRSEMVRLELRNSVHACQSSAGASPPNLPQPQQQQQQTLLSNGQYIPTAQHHHYQQQSQQQPTNFITSNLNNNNNNNNNTMVSYEDKLMPQQFFADTLSLLADQQVPCGLDDGFLDISATVDLFELFGCDYDTDSADTQRLIDKLLG